MTDRETQKRLDALDSKIDRLTSISEQLAIHQDTKEFKEAQKDFMEKMQYEVSWIGAMTKISLMILVGVFFMWTTHRI